MGVVAGFFAVSVALKLSDPPDSVFLLKKRRYLQTYEKTLKIPPFACILYNLVFRQTFL